MDSLPHYARQGKSFPICIKRYKTKTGKFINTDVNGAINIIRKEISDDSVRGIVDKGIMNMPKRVTPLPALERDQMVSETPSIAAKAA